LQLEGHELSYLRAIGVIILSAVLKRRMILADKAKSLFISKYAVLFILFLILMPVPAYCTSYGRRYTGYVYW
jgi:hypothetical protein